MKRSELDEGVVRDLLAKLRDIKQKKKKSGTSSDTDVDWAKAERELSTAAKELGAAAKDLKQAWEDWAKVHAPNELDRFDSDYIRKAKEAEDIFKKLI